MGETSHRVDDHCKSSLLSLFVGIKDATKQGDPSIDTKADEYERKHNHEDQHRERSVEPFSNG